MNRLRDILLAVCLIGTAWSIYMTARRVYAGEKAQITSEIGKPYAVLTIDYGEMPKHFVEGEFYVLKVLKVRGTKIDYGFCPIKRSTFYNKESDVD